MNHESKVTLTEFDKKNNPTSKLGEKVYLGKYKYITITPVS